ncbi:hypothetical protein GOP47_0017445 [Adiantum capillus-veneris]|uniref:Uncharacterized protein n=1 Tax=Adiantum capillus-veneris TaxID=13818 RepID=A0A9D4UFT7_ADICA|nr:hypothetical protein GOP47_0017445 [Adiantum capillus-veneris]
MDWESGDLGRQCLSLLCDGLDYHNSKVCGIGLSSEKRQDQMLSGWSAKSKELESNEIRRASISYYSLR